MTPPTYRIMSIYLHKVNKKTVLFLIQNAFDKGTVTDHSLKNLPLQRNNQIGLRCRLKQTAHLLRHFQPIISTAP